MKKESFVFIKSILLVVFSGIIGMVLLAVAFCIPLNRDNVDESIAALQKEGYYPDSLVLSPSYEELFRSNEPGVLISYNDLKNISIASFDDPGRSPLYKAALMTVPIEGYTYPRYWHGFVLYLRLFLLFFNYKEMRLINLIFQIVILFLLSNVIGNKIGIKGVALLFTSYILLMPTALIYGISYTEAFYIADIGTLFMLKSKKVMQDKYNQALLFCLFGILIVFFDKLIFPLYTFGFPMVWLLLCEDSKKSIGENLIKVIRNGIYWIIGYGGMWFMKWVLGSAILGRNLITEGIDQVKYRSSTEQEMVSGIGGRLEAALINWNHYMYRVFFMILLVWLVTFVVRFLLFGIKKDTRIPALLLLTFSSTVWFIVLANHTYGHQIFTYRTYNCGILALLSLFMIGTSDNIAGRDIKSFLISCFTDKKFWIRAISLVMMCVLACIIPLCMREETDIKNSDRSYECITINENNPVISSEFVPTFSEVKYIRLGIVPDSDSGMYKLSLIKNGSVIYTETVDSEKLLENPFYTFNTDWKLVAGDKYEIIIFADVDGPKGSYYQLSDGGNLLSDLSLVDNGGLPSSGQFTSYIAYMHRPYSMDFLFYYFTWFAVFGGVFLTAYYLLIQRNMSKNH